MPDVRKEKSMFFAKRLCTIPSCFLKGFEKSRGLRRLNLMAKMNLRKFQIWKWKLAAVLCSSLCSLFYLCCANSEWKENSTRIKAVLVHTKNTTNQACYLKGNTCLHITDVHSSPSAQRSTF